MIWWYVLGVAIAFLIIILAALYRIVPADYADVVIREGKVRVYSSHKEYSIDGKSAYFNIPSWFFLFKLGMLVHRIPLKVLTIDVPNFLSFDKDRARFECNIITYVTVNDPLVAAKRFSGDVDEMIKQISMVVQAITRDVTTKKAIREIINDREGVLKLIQEPLTNTIKVWGVELKDIELIDFKDPQKGEREGEAPSHVISDISSIIEEQINSEARQKNAEQKQIARTKEAQNEEAARLREIQKDEFIGRRDQEKLMKIAEQEKLAREQELEVTRVQKVKNQEIEKERLIVEAKQRKEVEEINVEQKRLEGEGDRKRAEEKAKGEAAPIRERGYAEADAKEKLQLALNKFGPAAITALVAQQVVDMQTQVGIAAANALKEADVKLFAGSQTGQTGFDIGQMVSAMGVSNTSLAESILNRLSRPNDLGIGSIDLGKKEEGKKPLK